MHSVDGVYEFSNVTVHEISPSRCLPNCDNFVVEHGHTLYSKIFRDYIMKIVKFSINRLNSFVDKPTTIYYGPKNSDCPLIVIPHGGPHAASLDAFIANAAFFVQIGNKYNSFIFISFLFWSKLIAIVICTQVLLCYLSIIEDQQVWVKIMLIHYLVILVTLTSKMYLMRFNQIHRGPVENCCCMVGHTVVSWSPILVDSIR